MPQGREAFFSSEAIELAVAGLAKDAPALLELAPASPSLSAVRLPVAGNGSTVALVLPEGALAPGAYTVRLDGKDQARLTVSSGVLDSTLLLSQTIGWEQLEVAGANFVLGNAFGFGRFAPGGEGPLAAELRASRSAGFAAFERAVAANLPTVVYMYWTGYVTHKPFGSEKSWAGADLREATRLLSFHAAQRLRRYERNIVAVGTIDEPGLSWGRTPVGGMASGFPNWDEARWYEDRGWTFTDDPASRPDGDWMRYMSIRCAILRESMEQAKRDLRAVWPGAVFSTDLYAPQAIMDGTDPLAQEANDVPATHVFVDWGIDRLGAYSGIFLEKSHDPAAKVAHAMNGQLFGETVPQPQQLHAYRVCLNGMLAAGLASNWWLNTGGMTPADLAAVNGPAKRVGPLFVESSVAGHDVAVLWSFTELAMREKDMAAREARRKPGEKILVRVDRLPEDGAVRSKEVDVNAYSIGGDYKEAVLAAHYALARAGYPAHIVHERTLLRAGLKGYRALVVVGQTFPLPGDVLRAISELTAAGGKVVVDRSTTVPFEGAVTADVDLKGLSHRWAVPFQEDPKSFRSLREASYFQTNHFMDEAVRRAVRPLKEAMRRTPARPCLETDSDEILAERHLAGEGFLYLAVNGHEELPEIPEEKRHWLYNYAPLRATFRLEGLPEACAAFVLEGVDGSRAGRLADPRAAIDDSFEPGEMKIYLVAPREPAGLDVRAEAEGSGIAVAASLRGLKMPWPVTVAVKDPAGKTLYAVHRATRADGTYAEAFPIGSNGAAGAYAVSVSSPLGGLAGEARAEHRPRAPAPRALADRVRAFDAEAIRAFLASRPEITIAWGHESHRAAASELAAALAARGLKVSVAPEGEALRKARYPRVWNPYARVWAARGEARPLEGRPVEARITLSTAADGAVTARTGEGKDIEDWRLPNALVTIAGEGYVDWIADAETCYEPGVVLHVDERREIKVVRGEMREERTSEAFVARWSKPWTRLTTHVGGYQLPPQLPEAYRAAGHLVLLGDSATSRAVAALQASDLLLQVADASYPGPGKALVSFAWSPFAVERHAIVVGASDDAGLKAGVERLAELAGQP
ncbi:MAG: hypothetical protein HY721_23515 [Planctomycetes bacterium]|nr:hypothetical protein [Planctomycetota bacterium]